MERIAIEVLGQQVKILELKEVFEGGCLVNLAVVALEDGNEIDVEVQSEAPWLSVTPPRFSVSPPVPAMVTIRVEPSGEKPGDMETLLHFRYRGANEAGDLPLEVRAHYRPSPEKGALEDSLEEKLQKLQRVKAGLEPSGAQAASHNICTECGAPVPDKRPYCSACRKKRVKSRDSRGESPRGVRRYALLGASLLILAAALILAGFVKGYRPARPEAEAPAATGALSITTDPPGASVIFLDGQYPMARTPLEIPSLPAGSYKVHFVLEHCGGADALYSLTVVPGRETSYMFHLERQGEMLVKSIPPGAPVMVDGKDTGMVTPALLEKVKEGRHEVGVADFSSAGGGRIFPVEVNWGERATLYVLGDSRSAALQLDGEAGSKVFLDGRLRGTLPLAVITVSPGIHTIEVRAKNCVPWKQRLSFSAGEVAELAIKPVREAILSFKSDEGTALFFNGLYKGELPQKVRVVPGKKIAVTVASHDGREWRREITPLEGEFRQEQVRLPSPPPRPPSPPRPQSASLSAGFSRAGSSRAFISPDFYQFPLGERFPGKQWKVLETLYEDIDNDGALEMVVALKHMLRKGKDGYPIHLFAVKNDGGSYRVIALKDPLKEGIGEGELLGISTIRIDDFGYRELVYVCGNSRRVTSQGSFVIHKGRIDAPQWVKKNL
ncbi:MAG: PEGA domain-containing protein [Candidatus Eremiobacteraeota bacterium]|nr:PEGA domain-containing protein [Candidatus Eremiobacteraeota bacterium]